MSKERLLKILQDTSPNKTNRLKNALDDYKGSFAVKYYLEATLELLHPTAQRSDRSPPVRKAFGTTQCAGCDGANCTAEWGELRTLPCGDGNLILCRSCYEHEMRFRQDEIMRGIQFDLPTWESLKVYAETR
jgi:hypothetical protein